MTDDREVGVGPHPHPWPDDPRFDRTLLELGDSRNVIDEYRYWSREAIVQDLDTKRHPFHVVIENWQHDFNIGTIVRNANAFLAHTVHIVGRRRWNRRGAMVTDRYQHIEHHETIDEFLAYAKSRVLPVVGIDIVDGSSPIEAATIPLRCVLAFGQEGPGLSPALMEHCQQVLHITQFGSTRSINVGVASGIAMHVWIVSNVASTEKTG
ncbi:MAG: TrmH family RNA methyltransferase [Acidimicrobiia bacterium]